MRQFSMYRSVPFHAIIFSTIISISLLCRDAPVWDKARVVVFTRYQDVLPVSVFLDNDSIGTLVEIAADTSLYPAYGSDGAVSFEVELGSHNIYARSPDDPLTGIFHYWSFDIEINKLGTYCYNLDKSNVQKEKLYN